MRGKEGKSAGWEGEEGSQLNETQACSLRPGRSQPRGGAREEQVRWAVNTCFSSLQGPAEGTRRGRVFLEGWLPRAGRRWHRGTFRPALSSAGLQGLQSP